MLIVDDDPIVINYFGLIYSVKLRSRAIALFFSLHNFCGLNKAAASKLARNRQLATF
jgi:hypothetical protein